MQRDKGAENQHKHKTKRQNPKHKQNPKKASSNQKCITMKYLLYSASLSSLSLTSSPRCSYQIFFKHVATSVAVSSSSYSSKCPARPEGLQAIRPTGGVCDL